MTQQKVFRIGGKGAGYEGIQEKSEEIPRVKPHEVRLKVHGVTLNFRDLAIANGAYPFPVKDNLVPLSDGAGVIEEVGEDVKDVATGDWAISNFDISNLYGPQKGE